MKINKETVLKLAHLSRLEVKENEMPALQQELGQILTWMDKLNEIDTEGVEPLIHLSLEVNSMRPDHVGKAFPRDKAMANAPKTDGRFFVVPKVVRKG